MKICKYCNLEKPDESFEVCKVVEGKKYYRQKCKECKKIVRITRRKKLRQWLDDYKKKLSCQRCGFSDFRALEFHHSNFTEKDFNVSDMIRSGSSIQTILKEIEKCEILCSNCHQIEHYEKKNN